ncbi:MAG: hypothetical protein N5P05_000314 [Chroococcopsis gigantea SAG 12.99]|jgi:FkbM family methyltransferase|nr:hypothetical protein [Chroococcopsis gigantea SAG 12.99]
MSLIVDVLKANKRLEKIHFTFGIIGSRDTGGNEISQWYTLAPNLTVYGFDADEDACEEVNQDLAGKNINWVEEHIPLALSNTEAEKTLHVTKALMCSSLYEPNEAFLKRFASLNELMDLDFTLQLPTTTLDIFCQSRNIQEIDFIHVDVQGASQLCKVYLTRP